MTTTVLTPMDRGKARQSGASLWRKQLLPLGEITYKGRRISFSREYLADLVKAFADKAYDVVPFQFADKDNSHTNKPEDRRGTVRGLELTDDGLDIIVAAGPQASEHLAEYPDLGVSARIVEDYDRADGKFFPAAIQHVLGTLDPRITGMRPWQAIDAANDDGDVLDLTDAEYAPPPDAPVLPEQHVPADPGTPATEEHQMALSADQEARLSKLLDLPDDKFDALLAAAGPAPEGAEDDDGTGPELSDAELQALMDEITDDETATETAPEGDKEPVMAGASLTAEAQAQIDLANSRAEETSLELARVTSALNRAAYEKERDQYSREYGIPPRITDLARPVLEGERHVVELANGSTADAGAIVRRVLKEIGQTVKMLDLSGEMGSPLDGGREAERAAEEDVRTERREMVSAVRKMTGI